jgi:hypothetical protein
MEGDEAATLPFTRRFEAAAAELIGAFESRALHAGDGTRQARV